MTTCQLHVYGKVPATDKRMEGYKRHNSETYLFSVWSRHDLSKPDALRLAESFAMQPGVTEIELVTPAKNERFRFETIFRRVAAE